MFGPVGVGVEWWTGGVERFDFVGDGGVFVGDDLVGDLGVARVMSKDRWPRRAAIASMRHAPVDGLGGEGVAELVGVDVADPGPPGDGCRPSGRRRGG